tara:strand:- start:10067 stop:10255 length:189 start_codon:yes stop_codon:yes gene_type:complete
MKKTKLTEDELKKYAEWVLSECDSPRQEIEWLAQSLPVLFQKDIKEHTLKVINKQSDNERDN